MSGSELAADTLPLRTQVRILPALRLVNIVHCVRNNNKSHLLSHLYPVRYSAQLIDEPIDLYQSEIDLWFKKQRITLFNINNICYF